MPSIYHYLTSINAGNSGEEVIRGSTEKLGNKSGIQLFRAYMIKFLDERQGSVNIIQMMHTHAAALRFLQRKGTRCKCEMTAHEEIKGGVGLVRRFIPCQEDTKENEKN